MIYQFNESIEQIKRSFLSKTINTPQKMKIALISLTIFLAIFSLTLAQQWYQRNNPHFITEPDYQRLVINPETRNNGVTILKFFTPWCRYCKYLKEIIDDLRAKQKWEITVYEVNCDQVNYHFCGRMGVHSYPKMAVFENGNFQENMDGFYPYQVVRELFVKYNRTSRQKPEEALHLQNVEVKEAHQEAHKETHRDTYKKQGKQEKKQETNFVQPEVVHVKNHEENRPKQEAKQEEHKELTLDHAQPQHQKTQEHKASQPAKPQEPHHADESKKEQSKHTQPVPVKEQHPPQKQEHPSPSVRPQSNATQPPSQPHQASTPPLTITTTPSRPNSPTTQPPTTASPKKPEQVIQEEENIAITDQDAKQTQKQKKIAEQIQKGNIDTVDLTKILPNQDHIQYGKYIIYGICLIVGGYYFVHIMKTDPNAESAKPHLLKSGLSSSKRSSETKIPANISIEDSELREELNFEHPNEEEVNFNSVEIRDEDL